MTFESLIRIGELYEHDTDILSEQIKTKGKREPALLRIIFDFDQREMYYELVKFYPALANKYKWIGHTFHASKEPVARLTFRNLDYFPGVIPNTRAKLEPFPECGELVKELKEIEEVFMEDENKLKNDLQTPKDYLKDKGDYDVVLFTVCVRKGGREIELASETYYSNAIKYLISPKVQEIKGKCHICGGEKQVLPDPGFESGTLLKVYVIDQPGYLSGVSSKRNIDALIRTFAICADCRYKLIAAEKVVSKRFFFRIGNLRGLFIPKFDFGNSESKEGGKQDLERFFKIFEQLLGEGTISDILVIDETMEEFAKGWYSFSLVFGEKEQANFVYFGTIQEVPLTRMAMLSRNIREISKKALDIWPDDQEYWMLYLGRIAGMIPKHKIGNRVEYQSVIDLLTALLKAYRYPRKKLYRFAVEAARIHHYESYYSVNISRERTPDVSLAVSMLRFNYLLLLMQSMEALQPSGDSVPKIEIEPNIEKWFSQMSYEPWMIGLFLTGYLMGRVGNEQYKKGDEKKSILDKIDFKGMRWERLRRLTAELLQSLRNYRILKYNEVIYYQALKLINESKKQISGNDPYENLFYILTGYSFATYSAIRGGNIE